MSILCAGLLLCAVMLFYANFTPDPVEIYIKAGDALVVETQQQINLNLADANTLMTIKDIGAITAQRIIDYREEYGGFKYLEELQNVQGIGTATYAAIAKHLTI